MINNDIVNNTSYGVIQQLANENHDESICLIDNDFYQKLKEDDRIIAFQIARQRLRKLRASDYSCDDIDRLTKEELNLSNVIKKEIENFLHIIENLQPIQETPIEIKFKEPYPNDRVGKFCTFNSWSCRNCENENHILCTSAVLTMALTSFVGESCCSCFRLHKNKHTQVKEFIPRGLFKKDGYDDHSMSGPIITDQTPEVVED